jgi:hypothetical protein
MGHYVNRASTASTVTFGGVGAVFPVIKLLPGVGVLLAVKRDHVAAVTVQSLAAGQAPGSAYCLTAAAADPEPGRFVPAVDA